MRLEKFRANDLSGKRAGRARKHMQQQQQQAEVKINIELGTCEKEMLSLSTSKLLLVTGN